MSHIRSLISHSKNYFFAEIAIKALAFIAIPVYTRLLSVEEYGVFNVFLATAGFFSVILSLSTETAVSRYYYDTKDETDFKKFVGTSSRITFFVFIFTTILFLFFTNLFCEWLNFSTILVWAIVPYSALQIVNSFFLQIYTPLMKSKKIAIISSLRTYSAFLISVIFIMFLFKSEKYYGQILGYLITYLLFSIVLINNIKKYYIPSFDRKYVKYILSFAVPQIPYYLSGIIISQIGRLIINSYDGFANAGIYSFASNIAALMLVVISVGHSAWNPYYFKYMNSKDYSSCSKDFNLIWKVTLIIALFLSSFSFELGALIGTKDYLSQLNMVPFFILGYIFYQWSYVYLRNIMFSRKTIWSSVVVFISGFSSILFSIMFYNLLGRWAVVFAFVASYFVMFIVSYAINKYVLKLYSVRVFDLLKPLIIYFVFLLFLYFTYIQTNITGIMLFVLKLIICFLFTAIMMYPYYNYKYYRLNK